MRKGYMRKKRKKTALVCPECGSSEISITHTDSEGKDSRMPLIFCYNCNKKFPIFKS